MKVAVGCDELGFELKNFLSDFLRTQTDVPLEVVFEKLDDAITLPLFRPARG